MDIIILKLQQGVSFIIPLVILLGLLIFVHELGHFLVGKFNKVRVEVFSLGFGKKLLKYKRGDTEYCISLFPLGGYVKFYGDDPTADIPEELKSVSFLHKPVGPRIAIVLAGPLMNFFFAILLFFIISMVGEDMAKPILGDVNVGTVAYNEGFRSGDEISKVGGLPVQTWEQVQEKIEENGDGNIKFTLRHPGEGADITIDATSKLVLNKNPISFESAIGEIQGLGLEARAARLGVSDPESLAFKSGLRSGDLIISVNGTKVSRWFEMERAIEMSITQPNLEFAVERSLSDKKEPQKLTVSVPTAQVSGLKTSQEIIPKLGLEVPDLFIAEISPKSAAEKAGLKKDDKILSINGTELKEWADLVGKVNAYKEGDPAFKLELIRDGQKQTMDVAPAIIERPGITGHKEKSFALGIVTSLVHAQPPLGKIKSENMMAGLWHGVTQTVKWSKMTALSFLRLIQARVSPKSIGGPIMIGELASKTFEMGLSPFLRIMAIISINLFVLNLLPVPVLDGGHLVFFVIEALRGAPLSMRKMEIAQQVGLVLLLGLMVFAFFNDVTRLLN